MYQKGLAWLGVLVLVLGVGLVSKTRADEKDAKIVDPTGTWTWESSRRDRTVTSTLKLKLQHGKVVGTLQGRGDEVKIENGKLEGDKLSFQYTRARGDRAFTVKYQGKVTAASIKGTLEFSFGDRVRTREWEAKRIIALADILGLWKFSSTRRNGEPLETSLKITRDGDKLKGLYTSPWREHEIPKITLKGNVLSFEYSGETDRGDFHFAYKGKVGRNSIKGNVEYKFGDREGSREFTGKREVKKKNPLAAVLGKWTLQVTRDNGETRESTIAITSGGGKLQGLYTSRRGEREAKNVQFKDGVLSFELSGETDRGDFRFVYKGKPSGNTIKGKVEFQFGDRTGSREFVGRREGKKEEQRVKL